MIEKLTIRPSKIIALGLNYRDHAEEFKQPIPEVPLIFMKPGTSVIYDGDSIVYPRGATRVDYEAELAVIISKTAKRVPQEKAREYILGYTCLNDVTERHIQKKDGQWTRAKGFDTFCPIGPVVTDEIDPSCVDIRSFVNGELKQQSNTSNLIFTIEQIVEFVTGIMTLLPGDIISTGTPSGVGPVKPGDIVTVEITGIGRLTNPVVAED